jgi:hypothetical protein
MAINDIKGLFTSSALASNDDKCYRGNHASQNGVSVTKNKLLNPHVSL